MGFAQKNPFKIRAGLPMVTGHGQDSYVSLQPKTGIFDEFSHNCSILMFYCSLLPDEVSSPCSVLNLAHSPCSLITP